MPESAARRVVSGALQARTDPSGTSVAAVEIVEARGRRGMDDFIGAGIALNRDDANWIAPLWLERRRALDRDRSAYFRHADAAFWLAYRGGRVVGRISAQIDQLWLLHHGEGTGHFGLLDAINDSHVVKTLLDIAEMWLRERGMGRVLGPLNLSMNQEVGLLVDGFDTPPMLMMGHAKPHLGALLGEAGYRKAIDVYAYRSKIAASSLPPGAHAMVDRVAGDKRIAVRPLRIADYWRDVALALEIFNDAWSGNWGFVPLTPEEMAELAREMRPLVSERLVWFADIDGEPAAMIVALPNFNEAIRDLGGRLAPFGWLKLLWRMKVRGVRTARVVLMGVKRKYASSFAGAALSLRLIEAVRRECEALGIRDVELSWILESNLAMRRIIETFGARRCKTYRLYEKQLAT